MLRFFGYLILWAGVLGLFIAFPVLWLVGLVALGMVLISS